MFATLQAKLIGIALLLSALGGGAFGLVEYGKHTQKTADDLVAAKLQLAEDKLINDARNANDVLTTKLEVDHANSEAALNTLLSAPAAIVRVPHCASSSKVNTASGSSVPVASPERASDTSQSAFDSFRQGVESDAAEWSRALNACQVVMSWAKSN
jgi:hypothetical protein